MSMMPYSYLIALSFHGNVKEGHFNSRANGVRLCLLLQRYDLVPSGSCLGSCERLRTLDVYYSVRFGLQL